jgi:hypothetical protein
MKKVSKFMLLIILLSLIYMYNLFIGWNEIVADNPVPIVVLAVMIPISTLVSAIIYIKSGKL